MNDLNKESENFGRRGFMKTIGSATLGLELNSFAFAAEKNVGVQAGGRLAQESNGIEQSANMSAQRGPAWLTPDYNIIAQLPPGQAGGYFMAPTLAKMPSGTLVAAFPWGTTYDDGGRSLRVLRFSNSTDKGATWKAVAELPYDSCEPNLYVHEGRLYLIITPNQNNTKLERSYFIRDGKWGIWACVSDNEGVTWSPIQRVLQGELTSDQQTPCHSTGGHTAMVILNGRLYLTVSDDFRELAAVSCQLDRGILDPDAWRISKMVKIPNPEVLFYKPNNFGSGMTLLEGNVVKVSGRLLVIARAVINRGGTANIGAVFEILDNGEKEPLQLQFLHFYPIPGGQMKFYILYDEPSQLYWMASSPACNSNFLIENGVWERIPKSGPGERRSLMLWYSVDSLNWFPAGWIAFAQGWRQSFHYPVMLVDGNDLAIIARTARASGNSHNVDTITFHRIMNFRDLAMDLTPIR